MEVLSIFGSDHVITWCNCAPRVIDGDVRCRNQGRCTTTYHAALSCCRPLPVVCRLSCLLWLLFVVCRGRSVAACACACASRSTNHSPIY